MSHQPTDGAALFLGILPADIKCSICLEDIVDDSQKGISKLQCGHFFHLACIGVAFNVKGAMVCPNCREVEDGGWRFFQVNNQPTPVMVEDGEEESGDDDDEEGFTDDGETYQENNTPVTNQGVPSIFTHYNDNSHNMYLQSFQVYNLMRAQSTQAERRFGPFPYNRMSEVPSFGYGGDGRNNRLSPLVQLRQHGYVGLTQGVSGSIGFQANTSAMSSFSNLNYHNRLHQNMNGFGQATGFPTVGTSAQGRMLYPPQSCPYLNVQAPLHSLPSSSTPSSMAQSLGLHGNRGLNAYTPELLNHGSSSSTAFADHPQLELGLNMSIGGGPLYGN